MPSREQIEELLTDEPQDVFLNYALAKAMAESGAASDAIAQFQKTLDLDSDHVPSYFQMGQTMAADGRVEEAKSTIARGLDVARKVGDEHAAMEMREFLDSL